MRRGATSWLTWTGAWVLGLLWALPLVYAVWTAFHPEAYSARFDLSAPLTLNNFVEAMDRAPFARYFLNTFILISMVLVANFVLCTLAPGTSEPGSRRAPAVA